MAQQQTVMGRKSCLVWFSILTSLGLVAALVALQLFVRPKLEDQRQAQARLQQVETHYQTCIAFQNMGVWDKAEAECEQVIALDANYKDVQTRLSDIREQRKAYHYQRGLDYMNTGQYAEAVAEFKIVMGLDTRYEDVQAKLNEAEVKLAEVRALTPTAEPVPTTTPIPPTATPGPSATATRIPTLTPIPPTATSIPPTATPGPSPTTTPPPEPALLFFDDFDAGPKPDWEVLSGKWGMAGEKYTLIDISGGSVIGVSLIGDPSWRDYAIEAEVTGLYDDGESSYWYSNEGVNRDDLRMSRAAILVRVQDNGDGVGLIVGAEKIEWATLIDSRWSVVSGTLVDGYGEPGTHLRIEVRGDVYAAYVDSKMITSFSDDRFPAGKIGIWLRSTDMNASDWRAVPKVDNFKVTKLD